MPRRRSLGLLLEASRHRAPPPLKDAPMGFGQRLGNTRNTFESSGPKLMKTKLTKLKKWFSNI